MLGLNTLAKKIFGSSNDRRLKPLYARVPRINALEGAVEKLTNDELRRRTADFRQQVANGGKLDDLLPEAFATGAGSKITQRIAVPMIGSMAVAPMTMAIAALNWGVICRRICPNLAQKRSALLLGPRERI